ncbi:hypothetical protein DUNSADRAFT_7589 [Dunaliella salina]|uniref:CCR4-NOT transcription complex subunit 10 n=1 Tax=Dunaliella salina TaxID=3046 RepID=A0ABQ7GL22_DUNSA|nr:hypothetical protein DUNSADRAFT_7589 [Dunaliella salina]|eukprot:KAF5835309.1 hypothetical protein DUNSADRAFT_7589 [Dunaliella salina]
MSTQVEGAAGCGGSGGVEGSLWQVQHREPLCLLRLAEAAINAYLQQRGGAPRSRRDGSVVESHLAGPSTEAGIETGQLREPDGRIAGPNFVGPSTEVGRQRGANSRDPQAQQQRSAGAPSTASSSDANAQQQRSAATPVTIYSSDPHAQQQSAGAPWAAAATAAAGTAAQARGVDKMPAKRPHALLEEAARALAAGLESLHVQMRMHVQQASAAEAAATEAALQMAVQGEELVASNDRGTASTSAAGQQGSMNGDGPACAPGSLTSDAVAEEASQELQLMAKGATTGWATDRAAQVHQALLANLAFLHLLRGDHQQALQAAQTLLDLPDDSLSPQLLLVGRCYAAEAQVALGNAAEAEGYLSAAILQMQEQPELLQAMGGRDTAPCPGMMAGVASMAAMLVNLAYVLCVEGCHEQARGLVQRALACNSSFKPACLLLVWLELAQGRTREALQLLQESSRSGISGMLL